MSEQVLKNLLSSELVDALRVLLQHIQQRGLADLTRVDLAKVCSLQKVVKDRTDSHLRRQI